MKSANLERGKFNVIIGGQAGSEGKGKVACSIIHDYLGTYGPKDLVLACNHMPNAGHTFRDVVEHGDLKYVARQFPTPAVFNKPEYESRFGKCEIPVILGPGSTINIDALEEEREFCGLEPGKTLFIHPNAGVVTDEHLEAEGKVLDNISSTKKGGGACIAAKTMRQLSSKSGKFPIARDLLSSFYKDALIDTAEYLNLAMMNGKVVFYEGAQGFDLDINHGLDYPFVTSRMSNVSQALADSGVPPSRVGSCFMVIRPYPIRVGNVKDKEGNTIGYSGDYANDNTELDWSKIAKLSGSPDDLDLTELTTVTGKVRRVFTFSQERFTKAVIVNDPTHLIISFADYIDHSLYGESGKFSSLGTNVQNKVTKFITKLLGYQNNTCMLSTGPLNDHVITFDN